MNKRNLLAGILAGGIIFAQETLAQQSYTFNAAGATGSVGPTQAMINTTYAATNLSGSVAVTNGIQSFTIPNTGLYAIEAFGASGGNRTNSPQRSGGFGAYIRGEFNLVQGDVLTILVGQRGVDGQNTASGGGGTYVLANNVLILAAGAGGGATGDNGGGDASVSNPGTNDFPGGSIPGGTNGSGGLVCNTSGANHGGGGAGYLGNGATSTLNNAAGGGLAFVNGGIGGASTVPGAFGGGGGATLSGVTLYGGGGGGGGYSGGAGGQQINHCTPGIARSGGGGGGSYNAGSAPTASLLTTQGDARVILSSLCNISIMASTNPICQGESVQLSTDAVSNITWNTTATTSIINVTPAVTTTYSVIGTSTANCNASSVISIIVNPLPQINTIVQPTMLCVGNEATITASGASTFTWSNTNIGQNTTVNPVVTSIYSVAGTSTAGCLNSTTVEVKVNTNSLSTTPDSQVCVGVPYQLNASGAITYTWNTGFLFPSITVTPSGVSSYTILGTDNHNCILSKVITLTSVPNPTMTVGSSPPIVCKGDQVILTADGAVSYSWNGAAGTNTLLVNPKSDVTYQYTVTGTDNNNCSTTRIFSLAVNACTGFDRIEHAHALNIYPNPTSGKITIESPESSVHVITLTDLSSRVIRQYSTSEQYFSFSIEELPAGVYLLNVSGDSNRTVRLIKE